MDLLIEIQAFYEKINNMTILSFHIQQNECFVAIESNMKITAHSLKIPHGETQGMVLIPFIQDVWKEVGCPLLRVLIAPRGPGSFTNLRVILAAAQGLSLAFPEADIFAPTHFDVLNHVARIYTKPPCLVLIDSKKGDFYGQTFYDGIPDIPIEYTIEQLEQLLVRNKDLMIISDADILGLPFPKERFITFDENLATCQINFYKTSSFKDDLEYRQFRPYYFHLPQYVKRTV